MAITATTPVKQETAFTLTLFLAFELGAKKWKLGFTTGAAQRPRERQVPAGDCQAVLEEIRRAKSRFGLPEEARVVSCYEAGRDGLWLHRFFISQGVANSVVDSASIEVNRRYRRAKTDRLDVHKLLTMLLRHAAGEQKVWSVVRVPSVVDEDRRQLPRELLTTKRDRTRVSNRIKGLLAGCGIRIALPGDVETQLEEVRQWDGRSEPPPTACRCVHPCEHGSVFSGWEGERAREDENPPKSSKAWEDSQSGHSTRSPGKLGTWERATGSKVSKYELPVRYLAVLSGGLGTGTVEIPLSREPYAVKAARTVLTGGMEKRAG